MKQQPWNKHTHKKTEPLLLELHGSSSQLLLANIDKATTCHTDRNKDLERGQEVASA
jgi:hypothetical protein